ncbi:hypothetical protein WICPIJ_005556 [Wickerhamomyces pijperi]|uniref:Uncharacterized protein n=1 Tax=Wickerhamomyces pijperi TaxID=599730 RepID=A0A9P8Q5J0_WICPI|nr:hypothetical protein WICPIJ_005556 [Wickerhamomyces pijperi]
MSLDWDAVAQASSLDTKFFAKASTLFFLSSFFWSSNLRSSSRFSLESLEAFFFWETSSDPFECERSVFSDGAPVRDPAAELSASSVPKTSAAWVRSFNIDNSPIQGWNASPPNIVVKNSFGSSNPRSGTDSSLPNLSYFSLRSGSLMTW